MFESRWLLKWLSVGLILGVGVVLGIINTLPDRKLHLVACDVGQGDAIFVSLDSTQVLVDGGPDSSVLECLSAHMPLWDRTLEMVVLTHGQADHLGGLVDALERYEVENLIANGLLNQTEGFRAFREAVIEEGVGVHLPSRGDEIRLDQLRLTILWPEKRMGLAQVWESASEEGAVLGAATYPGDLNETSVVIKLSFRAFDALLVGDIGFSTEKELIADGVVSDVEVLKVGHHGSKYSSSQSFLEAVKPEAALISAGEKNRFGHPTAETLERLELVGADVFRTDQAGEIEVVSDGRRFWVID